MHHRLKYVRATICFLAIIIAVIGTEPCVFAQTTPSKNHDVILLDKILAGVRPGQDTVRIDDMLVKVSLVRATRNRLAGDVQPRSSFWDSDVSLWPLGVVPYVFHSSVSSAENRQMFRDACRRWEAVANVRFVPKTKLHRNYLIVHSADAKTGNSSHIGMSGGPQALNIYSWDYDGRNGGINYIICHELGHALGLLHEQSRSDRDVYVTVQWANITAGVEYNFAKLDTSINEGPYDYDSVMHYRKDSFSKNPARLNTIVPAQGINSPWLDAMGQRKHLSARDKSGMSAMYGPPSTSSSPLNDNFATPRIIKGSLGRVIGSTLGATREAGEPYHRGATGGSSTWFRWQAPNSISQTIDTAGSDFDTLLAVYRGSSLGSLTRVVNNDDVGISDDTDKIALDTTSRVTFNAVAGQVYYIAVDGYRGAVGALALNWKPTPGVIRPPNDNFATPGVLRDYISGNWWTNGYSDNYNGNATKEYREPAHAGKSGGTSVWWYWIAPANGTVTFSTVGSDFDTLLAVYTGSSVGSLTHVASSDDYYSDRTSQVSFYAYSGQSYRIAIDGYNGASGNYRLNVSAPSAYSSATRSSTPTGTSSLNIGTARSTALLSSPLSLSTAVARPDNNSVRLTFTGALDAVSVIDPAHYSVEVNGVAVAMESASYDAGTNAINVGLAAGTLRREDHVLVRWVSLSDANGRPVTDGEVTIVAR